MTTGRERHQATGNASYGWFIGGKTSPTASSVDRLDYSNDTTNASPRGPMRGSTYNATATGNQNYGYNGGGYNTPFSVRISSVDRIDYSNDTPTAAAKGPLTAARDRLGSSSNSDFGYFNGGTTPTMSTIDRIDFSNDTPTATKGPLSQVNYQLQGTAR